MRVSVVIPTFNEADRIPDVIRRAKALGDCEIIVVDGQSDDGTFERAVEADVRLSTPRGRAVQQNAGAAAARGEMLLFLHADCRLDAGAFEAAAGALAAQRVIAGCFRQSIDAPGLRYRLLEGGNAARVRLLGWVYGDQGLFLRRETFERLGRFPEVPILEDWLFAKRLKRSGRIALADSAIYVSARRWQRNGILCQTLVNWTIIGLAQLGMSPSRLTRLYGAIR